MMTPTYIVHVLCEGHTEAGFVSEVLKPFLQAKGINSVKSIIVKTNKKKGAEGGVVSCPKVVNDLNNMLKQQDSPYECHLFTSMIDFYALPNDFPGYKEAMKINDHYLQVKKLEEAWKEEVGERRFIPYIQLHEFEALLFADLDLLKLEVQHEKEEEKEKAFSNLYDALKKVDGNPELVNNGVDTAPSKRIIKAVEGKLQWSYNKPLMGKRVTKSIGMETLLDKCSHFREWINQLLQLIES